MFGSLSRATGAALVVVGVLALPATASSCPAADVVPSVPYETAAAATVCLVNEVRARHGAPPLRPSLELAAAGRDHAKDMVARDYFAHDTPEGRDFVSRIFRRGYVTAADSGWKLGENLAVGSGSAATPRAVVEAWIASPGHHRNLVDPDFRDVGIAVVEGAPTIQTTDEATYAAEFGHRRAGAREPRASAPRRSSRRKRRGSRRPARRSARSVSHAAIRPH